ncbi:hypothetical protein GF351_04730, partial [Candidatus Woesearchaeota archaeon]|nr:hypothetical protein [Candidatus Woesearchaeota archaeon]
EIEKDVNELVGSKLDEEMPVVLDFESIRVLEPGQYEIDLVHLFKNDPLVFRLADGKYMIDVQETFKQMGEKKR